MSRIFAGNPNIPAPPAPDPEPVDEWQVKMLAALDQLAAAVLDRPAPIVEVAPPDLTSVINAVQGIKGPATADEIAEALARVLALRDEPTPNAALTEVAEALKNLDFRMKGMGTQAYGGGSVSFSPQALNQLAAAINGTTTGTWGYESGATGTVTLTGGKRVLAVTAISLGAQGSFTINSGDPILLPYDSTDKASSSLTIEPKGNLTDPTIEFDAGIDAYFIEYVT